LGEFFAASTEKLAENALLDIMIFPDRRGKSIDKLIIELRVFRKLLEFLDLFISEH
jgi:hypothetical protein